MKKILVVLAIFAIVGGLVSAQAVKTTVYNEVYSRTANKDVAPDTYVGYRFWGLRNRAYAKVEAERWGVEARYQLFVKSGNQHEYSGEPDGDYALSTSFAHDNYLANIWFKPINGLTIFFGNDYGRQVAAGSVTAWDGRMGYMARSRVSGFRFTPGEEAEVFAQGFADPDDTIFNGNASRYASDGLTVEVTAIPGLLLAFNLPATSTWMNARTFTMPFNAALDWNIAKMFDIGIVYKGGFGKYDQEHSTFGAYADFVGVPGLKIQLGWTGVVNPDRYPEGGNAQGGRVQNGMPISQIMMTMVSGSTEDYEDFEYGRFASLFDLALQYQFNNGILLSAAAEVGMGYDYAFPLSIAAFVDFPNIVSTFGIDCRFVWENIAFVERADAPVGGAIGTAASFGNFKINPNLKFALGPSTFKAGVNIGINYYNSVYEGAVALDNDTYVGFNIPVEWRYYF